jgi:hypothetical protein
MKRKCNVEVLFEVGPTIPKMLSMGPLDFLKKNGCGD